MLAWKPMGIIKRLSPQVIGALNGLVRAPTVKGEGDYDRWEELSRPEASAAKSHPDRYSPRFLQNLTSTYYIIAFLLVKQ